MKKIIIMLLILVLTISFVGCKESEDTVQVKVLDFSNFSNEELSELDGEVVCIYGYFLLNTPVDNMAYIGEIPFQTLHNKNHEVETYAKITMQDNGVLPVIFMNSHDLVYQSTPLCFVGKITKKDYYDNQYGFYSEYILANATFQEVDQSNFQSEKTIKYKKIAKTNVLDIIYVNIIELQYYFENTLYDDFDFKKVPEPYSIDSAKQILEGLEENDAVKTALTILNTYIDAYENAKKINNKEEYIDFQASINTLYEIFDAFVTEYGVVRPAVLKK